jgi:hypothetical protein
MKLAARDQAPDGTGGAKSGLKTFMCIEMARRWREVFWPRREKRVISCLEAIIIENVKSINARNV